MSRSRTCSPRNRWCCRLASNLLVARAMARAMAGRFLRALAATTLAAACVIACHEDGDVASPALGEPGTPSQCAGEITPVVSPRRIRRLGDHELDAVLTDLL